MLAARRTNKPTALTHHKQSSGRIRQLLDTWVSPIAKHVFLTPHVLKYLLINSLQGAQGISEENVQA
jgi:hypothetical protein